jgi:hypothetical protein
MKFLLTNLNCDACGKVSRMKIGKISGVKSVTIEQSGNEAKGDLEADRDITINELQEALAGTQYKVHAV